MSRLDRILSSLDSVVQHPDRTVEKIDAMNHEKTHIFLPGYCSLELCQTEQQDNVVFDIVEVSFPRVLLLR